jgi:spore germination cell wall hydrolase CwlJ-like protein
MFFSLRSGLLVAASIGASSVAPAQVGPTVEPLLASNSATVPSLVVPQQTAPEEVAPAMPLEVETHPEAPATALDIETRPEKPSVNRKQDLASLVAELRSSEPGSRELECLAAGVYFESKSEPLAGQLAVGQVIANRAESRGRFPSSYCGVLTQRGQFSFVRGGRWPAVNKNSLQWKNAVAVARIVEADLHASNVGKALFFHARRVSPGWRLTRVASVGNHVFYR